MASTLQTDALSIFDILNIYVRGGPKRTPTPDETHRYYLCQETATTKECMKVPYSEVKANTKKEYSAAWVKADCPQFNDQVVLSWKLKGRVSLVPNLNEGSQKS